MARYDLAVVGMGSAGMTAVEFAAQMGVRVCAIERDRVGGDCLWTGCVPSKALLAAARAAHAMRTADRFGLEAVEPQVDTARVLDRVRALQAQLAATTDSPDRFTALGVDVLTGAARLTSGTTLELEGHGTVQAKHVLLATGSRPAVPPIDGLEAAGYVTSDSVWDLQRAPGSFVIVGGGPIAIEQAQGWRRLGVEVTVLEREDTVLPRDEPDLVRRLVAALTAEGVRIETGVAVDRVTVEGDTKVVHAGGRSWRADEILVAVGRAPRVVGLGLEDVGIETGPQGIVTDGGYRTSVKTVSAVGDVAGRFLFTHSAGYEAARAVRNALFPGRDTGAFTVPWCTFTDPELAHVGLTAAQAREQHGAGDVEVHVHELAESDRARAEDAAAGAIVVVTHKGRVVGGHALAPGAGELIHELALAVHQAMKLKDLASMVHVYPTLALGIQQLAAEQAYASARRLRWLIR